MSGASTYFILEKVQEINNMQPAAGAAQKLVTERKTEKRRKEMIRTAKEDIHFSLGDIDQVMDFLDINRATLRIEISSGGNGEFKCRISGLDLSKACPTDRDLFVDEVKYKMEVSDFRHIIPQHKLGTAFAPIETMVSQPYQSYPPTALYGRLADSVLKNVSAFNGDVTARRASDGYVETTLSAVQFTLAGLTGSFFQVQYDQYVAALAGGHTLDEKKYENLKLYGSGDEVLSDGVGNDDKPSTEQPRSKKHKAEDDLECEYRARQKKLDALDFWASTPRSNDVSRSSSGSARFEPVKQTPLLALPRVMTAEEKRKFDEEQVENRRRYEARLKDPHQVETSLAKAPAPYPLAFKDVRDEDFKFADWDASLKDPYQAEAINRQTAMEYYYKQQVMTPGDEKFSIGGDLTANRFTKDGQLIPTNKEVHVAPNKRGLKIYSVNALRAYCQIHLLTSTGSKEQVIDRIKKFIANFGKELDAFYGSTKANKAKAAAEALKANREATVKNAKSEKTTGHEDFVEPAHPANHLQQSAASQSVTHPTATQGGMSSAAAPPRAMLPPASGTQAPPASSAVKTTRPKAGPVAFSDLPTEAEMAHALLSGNLKRAFKSGIKKAFLNHYSGKGTARKDDKVAQLDLKINGWYESQYLPNQARLQAAAQQPQTPPVSQAPGSPMMPPVSQAYSPNAMTPPSAPPQMPSASGAGSPARPKDTGFFGKQSRKSYQAEARAKHAPLNAGAIDAGVRKKSAIKKPSGINHEALKAAVQTNLPRSAGIQQSMTKKQEVIVIDDDDKEPQVDDGHYLPQSPNLADFAVQAPPEPVPVMSPPTPPAMPAKSAHVHGYDELRALSANKRGANRALKYTSNASLNRTQGGGVSKSDRFSTRDRQPREVIDVDADDELPAPIQQDVKMTFEDMVAESQPDFHGAYDMGMGFSMAAPQAAAPAVQDTAQQFDAGMDVMDHSSPDMVENRDVPQMQASENAEHLAMAQGDAAFFDMLNRQTAFGFDLNNAFGNDLGYDFGGDVGNDFGNAFGNDFGNFPPQN